MSHVFDCLNYSAQHAALPDAQAAVPIITSLVHQAHRIYLLNATSDVSRPDLPAQHGLAPLLDTTSLIQYFKVTLEKFPPTAPGEHVLIWAIYIVAADCTLPEHKAYFDFILHRYHARSGFVNILRGLEKLHDIWDRRGRGPGHGNLTVAECDSSHTRWTTLLPEGQFLVM